MPGDVPSDSSIALDYCDPRNLFTESRLTLPNAQVKGHLVRKVVRSTDRHTHRIDCSTWTAEVVGAASACCSNRTIVNSLVINNDKCLIAAARGEYRLELDAD